MATNLQIDDQMILKAAKLGGHRTKKSAVIQALTEYIQRLEQQKIISIFGQIDYCSGHNYKRQRTRL